MSSYCPEVLVTAVTTAAISMSKDLCSSDIVLLASMFTQLGDTLNTIVAARASCEEETAPLP